MIMRAQFIEAGLALQGVPWVDKGRDPARGLDCIGVLLGAAVGCGLCSTMNAFGAADYPRVPDGSLVNRLLEAGLIPISPADRQPGDILAFSLHGRPWHCGILVSRDPVDTIVHGHYKNRRVVAQIIDRDANTTYGLMTHAFQVPGLS